MKNHNLLNLGNRVLSLLLVFLVVSMVPAYAQAIQFANFVNNTTAGSSASDSNIGSESASSGSGVLFVNASIPAILPEQRFDVNGKSVPGAQITLFVNDVLSRSTVTSGSGEFVFVSVALLPGENVLVFVAEQNGQVARRQFGVVVDISLPNISISIPDVALSSPLQVNASTTKPLKVRYSVQGQGSANSGVSGFTGIVPVEKTLSVSGNFVLPLELAQGRNIVRIIMVDEAGHSFERVVETVYDTVAPQFLQNELNLKDLSPTYTADIKVRGKLSEPATVFGFLNNEKSPSSRVLTKSDGSFELPLTLRRDVKTSIQKTRVSIETGHYSVNMVRLEAVDAAGLRTVLPPVPVSYAVCGQGSAYRVELGQPIPDLLNTR
ncbi:MAG: carboxypeptidase-like regulatory domain-containing protein, partial [Candidatus Woesearchaeota archaeon]|nr:carboxypeptidase-like regulatory domain-containing protein [Candidatus Woesearchaeota archaeon]